MKPNSCLVIDTWEGQLEIDEAVLKANGVAGMGIRINDMNGGHHLDSGFSKQWAEASNFVRFPYFVYNPWVDGSQNFAWLKANMPADARSVAIDIEVAYPGYSPVTYAGEVNKFLALCAPFWKTIIYTGAGFTNLLSKWPTFDYWWAQYPSPSIYLSTVKTWVDLKVALDKLDRPFNESVCPGKVKMWQFSGDYLVLPGNIQKMDVSIFYGTEQELAEYFNQVAPISDPSPAPVATPQPDLVGKTAVVMKQSVNVRQGPGTQYTVIGMARFGDKLTIYGTQLDAAGNVWGKLQDAWICMIYQGSTYVQFEDTFPHLYKIKDDIQAGVPPRPYLRVGLPSTVPTNGGTGFVKLSDAWMKYLASINDSKAMNYLFKPSSGWHNTGDSNLVRELTFSGNIVEVTRIENGKAYIKTAFNNENPPSIPVLPTAANLHPLVHLFSTQYSDHLNMDGGGRLARIILIANPGESLWMNTFDLIRL